jgi:hypothetical protein
MCGWELLIQIINMLSKFLATHTPVSLSIT